MVLSVNPIIGAIAAGCTVILKPSESSPTCSQLLADLFAKYLDPDAFAVVLGAVPETSKLLELPFDHIFYTGSTRVGRIVAQAAAKHITPVTLELGGKSPVFVDGDSTDLDVAAKRILWGKLQNTGQLCVSPDWLLVPRRFERMLVESFKKAYDGFFPYPDSAIDEKSTLSKMISPVAQERIQGLLSSTRGKIEIGGKSEGSRISPAIVTGVDVDDVLMEEYVKLGSHGLIITYCHTGKYSVRFFLLLLWTISMMPLRKSTIAPFPSRFMSSPRARKPATLVGIFASKDPLSVLIYPSFSRKQNSLWKSHLQ